MKLTFQRIFDNPLYKYPTSKITSCICIGYISSYLSKLEYVQWVSNSTQDPQVLGSNSADGLGWVKEWLFEA